MIVDLSIQKFWVQLSFGTYREVPKLARYTEKQVVAAAMNMLFA